MEDKSAEEIKGDMIWYCNVRRAHKTHVMPIITVVILVNSRQGKERHNEIYIVSLHKMTMTMTIIIQWIVMAWR